MLVVILVVIWLGLDFASRDEQLIECIEQLRESISRDQKTYYDSSRIFIDQGDCLVLDDLPSADYSSGGVTLLGASNCYLATRLRSLPRSERRLIRNYGMSDANSEQQRQFLEFLIEQQGLLSAGPNRNVIVFGVSYHAASKVYRPDSYFPRLWSRHGLYTCSREEGIASAPMSALRRRFRLERLRVSGLIRITFVTMSELLAKRRVRTIESSKINALMAQVMGQQWEDAISREIQQFRKLVDYTASKGASIAVVLLPHGTWENDLPFKQYYDDKLQELCREKNITLLDWSSMLVDEEFADAVHSNVAGAEKTNQALVNFARSRLRAMNSLRE
jgi:hypothetical protein